MENSGILQVMTDQTTVITDLVIVKNCSGRCRLPGHVTNSSTSTDSCINIFC